MPDEPTTERALCDELAEALRRAIEAVENAEALAEGECSINFEDYHADYMVISNAKQSARVALAKYDAMKGQRSCH